ncbi:MAG TPA: cell division protein ZapA [Candidatus Cloacimonetes bacterium]|jgi:cell division protein ZapA (FtsZ GTPase activity inhibitor)|nr:cell division protein ZapA [Candidatus Cloacimonas sp.]HHZ15373.1 cell division protein ZapA [Candidatus Cloacimonadota bacterium]
MQSVEVEILGRKHRLRTDNPEQTKAVAEAIDNRLNELQVRYEMLDYSRLLLLAILQMQNEIFELDKNNQNLNKELEKLNQMIGKIISDS